MKSRIHLLDIEGTTSSIAYVYETLFPYIRAALPDFLERHWNDAVVRAAAEKVLVEAGQEQEARTQVSGTVLAAAFALMDRDSKATALKELQGLVSREGYESGKLRSHFYPDVPRALERWTYAGIRCCVYSSGSIDAQKSFYRYAEAGDLSLFISANFDTTSGPKREAASYARIAAALNRPPRDILFFSDVVEELDAAKSAGMQTALVIRPGNKAVAPGHGHRSVQSFDEVA